MGFLEFLEQTSLATFIRESDSFFGFPGFLCLHTLGLSVLVGINVIVAVRLLGLAPSIPIKPLGRLFRWQWIGLVMSTISGIGLAISRATFVFANWLLPVKLVFVVIAAVIMWRMEKTLFRRAGDIKPGEGKTMAAALIVLWVLIMTDGRLIAYSSTIFSTAVEQVSKLF